MRSGSRSRSVKLVQSQLETRHERLEEVTHFGEPETFDARPECLLSFREFLIARRGLLQTLEIGTELVGGPDELAMGFEHLRGRSHFAPRRPADCGFCGLILTPAIAT